MMIPGKWNFAFLANPTNSQQVAIKNRMLVMAKFQVLLCKNNAFGAGFWEKSLK